MEHLRRIVKIFVSPRSRLYKTAALLCDALAIFVLNGPKAFVEMSAISRSDKKEQPVVLKIRQLLYPFLVRPGTSDIQTVTNNIIRAEYGKYVSARDPKWMIDAGAYIGDTAAYFLSRFPSIKVIALEPQHENFLLAEQNLKAYGSRVVVLKKGLYGQEGSFGIAGEQTAASLSASGDPIECVTVDSLMRDYNIKTLDILKVDIEGAERSVFLHGGNQWLENVKEIIMELHGDELKSKVSCEIKSSGFECKVYRSTYYFWRR